MKDEDDKLILHVKDWDTMNFLLSNYKERFKGLVANKKILDQTVVLRIRDTDVLSWKGALPIPSNLKSYFRLLRTYLKN